MRPTRNFGGTREDVGSSGVAFAAVFVPMSKAPFGRMSKKKVRKMSKCASNEAARSQRKGEQISGALREDDFSSKAAVAPCSSCRYAQKVLKKRLFLCAISCGAAQSLIRSNVAKSRLKMKRQHRQILDSILL
jgi:hypothetical protein